MVCVGGGAVAARRIRRFLGAGAQVAVVSPEVGDAVREWAASGLVEWLPRGYAGPDDLIGTWLVHVATGVPAVDAAVAADAEAAHIFCINAADATQGTAQMLASRTVETTSGTVRVSVHGGRDPHRAGALVSSVAGDIASGRHDVRARRPRPGMGWVALVGGGPGDAGLLTRAGWESLRSADVVVIDRLAPRAVLDDLPPDVRVIEVGKAPGLHMMVQEDINETLVREARAGWGVVRLKGGDPYVLGRGGEERLALEAAGVPVREIPGVTSAIAAPAVAGIPVTHRGIATGFSVVSGHEAIGALPVRRDHTLVFLMGVSRLASIVASLLDAGHAPDLPVAIIERAFAPDQRVTIGTLESIVDAAAAVGVQNPAVIVVGDVVRLGAASCR